MASREVWKRRLGPLFGGAVALASSSAMAWPALACDDDAPVAGWMIAVGAALGLAGYAIAALGHGLGLPPAACTALALMTAVLLGGAAVERGFAAYLSRGRDPAMIATAVAGSLLVRAQLLAAIAPDRWLWSLLTIWVVGRWAAVFLQAIGDPLLEAEVDPRSSQRVEIHRPSLISASPPAWAMLAVTAAVASATVTFLGWTMLLGLAATALLVFAIGLQAQRKRGGIDAAVVATAALTGELVTLLALSAR